MELSLIHFLIICPMMALAGFVDAVAGGGGLISLPAMMIAGLPVNFAVGTGKVCSCMGMSLAIFRYAKAGMVPWKLCLFGILSALLGSALGAKTAMLISDSYLKIMMLFILPGTAMYLLRGRVFAEDREPFGFVKTSILVSFVAFILGFYDGFYGPGTGTFLLLLLPLVAHIKLAQANGATKVINFTSGIGSFVVYLMGGKILWTLGILGGLCNLLGSYFGTRAFMKGGARSVRPVMLFVLCIFFVKVLMEVLGLKLF